MGFSAAHLLFLPLLTMTLAAQGAHLPDVVERTLGNRMRLLLVERPGSGAVHAELFLRGGRADTGGLPPAAADLLGRTLFGRMLGEDLERRLDPVLKQEAGAAEALRLEALRLTRGPGAGPSPDLANLQALHSQARASLFEQLRPVEERDALDELGVSHRSLRVAADYLAYGVDLPAAALRAWCQLEAGRLKRLPLGRFPLELERLNRELAAGTAPLPASLSSLLATALAGQPYAQVADFQRARIEALTREDLRTLAGAWLAPEHLTLVVVGDFQAEPLVPVLERVFAGLGSGSGPNRERQFRFDLEDTAAGGEASGGRRLLVSSQDQPQLYLGWRVPPANHPDGAALRALAQVLGGSASARLQQNLCGPRGLARSLSLDLGVPGQREGNLLVITAEPAPGRSLEELEQGIINEVLRIQREPLTESEVRRAQVRLEASQVMLQEDAGALARAMGEAHCQGGDWRLAFRALESGRDLLPADIQGAARRYLVPARSTLVLLGPDPLLMAMDRVEGRLLQVLTTLVQRKVSGEAQSQNVLREAMRQIRMLSPAEREQTLKLLEAQVRP